MWHLASEMWPMFCGGKISGKSTIFGKKKKKKIGKSCDNLEDRRCTQWTLGLEQRDF